MCYDIHSQRQIFYSVGAVFVRWPLQTLLWSSPSPKSLVGGEVDIYSRRTKKINNPNYQFPLCFAAFFRKISAVLHRVKTQVALRTYMILWLQNRDQIFGLPTLGIGKDQGQMGTCSGGGEKRVGKEKKRNVQNQANMIMWRMQNWNWVVVLVSRWEFHRGVDTYK